MPDPDCDTSSGHGVTPWLDQLVVRGESTSSDRDDHRALRMYGSIQRSGSLETHSGPHEAMTPSRPTTSRVVLNSKVQDILYISTLQHDFGLLTLTFYFCSMKYMSQRHVREGKKNTALQHASCLPRISCSSLAWQLDLQHRGRTSTSVRAKQSETESRHPSIPLAHCALALAPVRHPIKSCPVGRGPGTSGPAQPARAQEAQPDASLSHDCVQSFTQGGGPAKCTISAVATHGRFQLVRLRPSTSGRGCMSTMRYGLRRWIQPSKGPIGSSSFAARAHHVRASFPGRPHITGPRRRARLRPDRLVAHRRPMASCRSCGRDGRKPPRTTYQEARAR